MSRSISTSSKQRATCVKASLVAHQQECVGLPLVYSLLASRFHLLSWIVERLEALNTPREPTFRAWVTLRGREQHPRSFYQARVTLILAGHTCHAKGTGLRLEEAVATALEAVAQAVHTICPPQLTAT